MLGADPELFVNRKDGTSLPIFGLIGGTKEHPLPLFDGDADYLEASRLAGFMYQEDGAALEFNIPPANTYDRFRRNIQTAVSGLTDRLLTPKGLIASPSPYIELNAEQLSHPLAQRLGCSPDQYAYDQKLPNFTRQPFQAKDLGATRYAGGHLHLTYNKDAMPAHVAAQFMDLHVGLSTVGVDVQGGRRKHYGLAGLYREKPYGIEYRTLSNYWIFKGSDYISRLAMAALTFAGSTYDQRSVDFYKAIYSTVPWNDVHDAISNEDHKLAQMLVQWTTAKGLSVLGIY